MGGKNRKNGHGEKNEEKRKKRKGKKGEKEEKRKRRKREKEGKRKKGGKICPKKFLFKLNKGEKIWNLPFFPPSSVGKRQGGKKKETKGEEGVE